MFRPVGLLAIFISLVSISSIRAETLEQYAEKCDKATHITVPDFDCDAGTDVPVTHPHGTYPDMTCDRPNRLNGECDPGSRFQVLKKTSDAFVVAHCRKRGAGPGIFRDIAVIQHNTTNGATCFYQALDDKLPGKVYAPSKGQTAWRWWKSPSGTADIGCAGCHDNGAIIRSPYLSQLKNGPNALPGAGNTKFNRNQPYSFVGEDFASWKAYKVEVNENYCNNCHRLGVNRVRQGQGTASDFAIRATSMSEAHKNLPSADSPLWMPPNQFSFDQSNYDAAQKIQKCALRVNENPLPNSLACHITLFAGSFTGTAIAGAEGVHSGVFLQSSFGSRGNFEFVAAEGDRLNHYWRNNDRDGSWHGPFRIAQLPAPPTPLAPTQIGDIGAAPVLPQSLSMIQNNNEDLEIVANVSTDTSSDNHLVYYIRDASGWHGPVEIISDGAPIRGISGNPALIQSNLGINGSLELVVVQNNLINHYWRDNDVPGRPWHGPTQVTGAQSALDGSPVEVALIQSNFGNPGNLELVAHFRATETSKDFLAHYFRDNAGWHGPLRIKADNEDISGVTGAPSFMQSDFGIRGNFELVVSQGNQLNHYWRDNDSNQLSWYGPFKVAEVAGRDAPERSPSPAAVAVLPARPTSVSLMQSNYGSPGNLEVIVRFGSGPTDSGVGHIYRDGMGWHGYPINADGTVIRGMVRF
jgi:hypothetical protein